MRGIFFVLLLVQLGFTSVVNAVDINSLNKHIQQYDYVSDVVNGFIEVRKNNSIGLINVDGNVIVKPSNSVDRILLNNGGRKNYAVVCRGSNLDTCYVFDGKGNVIFDGDKYLILELNDACCKIVDETGKFGLYNCDNKKVILPCKYKQEDIKFYFLGGIGVKDTLTDTYDLYDRNGVFLKKSVFSDYFSFVTYNEFRYEKKIICEYVKVKGKWHQIDSKGNLSKFSTEEQYPTYILDGHIFNNLKSAYNSDGKLIISVSEREGLRTYNNVVGVVNKYNMGDAWNNKVTLLYDENGKKTDKININNDLYWKLVDGKWQLYGNSKKAVSNVFYENIIFPNEKEVGINVIHKSVENKFFPVCRNGKWGVINLSGNEIVPCKYAVCKLECNAIKAFSSYDALEFGDTYELYSYSGDPILSNNKLIEYKPTYSPEEMPFADYYNGEYFSLVDKKTNKVVVPFCLDYVGICSDGLVRVGYKGKVYFINSNGEGLPVEAYK